MADLRSVDRQFRPLVRAALEQGWGLRIRSGRSPHPSLIKGSKRIIIPGSPSDRRAWLNMRAHLRREGVKI